jgi:hypothetical protein
MCAAHGGDKLCPHHPHGFAEFWHRVHLTYYSSIMAVIYCTSGGRAMGELIVLGSASSSLTLRLCGSVNM